ncbi:TetR family transcriptional regulator [Actinocatenispora thailandica]|uniref:TetR family transcriptional regulator n=1 Tax=Actinocatenispora thailandica TaxID=227318 RepID=A0A7R7HY69_9ACTN|nr:TetR family transcriptional regulator [Actinocatenispora thailandica]BCJ36997.1 TetR family transcriptional regulator [Actinocatenispora thailandica]
MARRTQGTSAGLDRGKIARAAVTLVDRDGLERFGVRRLAQELGVDPMSIYHHHKGKAALLDAMSEVVLVEMMADAGDPPDGWVETARWVAQHYRALAYRHPEVFPLLVTRAQTAPVALTALDRLIGAMRTAGLPDRVVADAPMTLFGFLNGYLLAVLNGQPGTTPAVDPSGYPQLAAVAPLQADYGTKAEFDRLLDTVLAGIRSRAAGT